MSSNMAQVRLNKLCADYDRTAPMGMFPHQQTGTPIEPKTERDAMSIAGDASVEPSVRDQAIWSMVYRETSGKHSGLTDLLYTVAIGAKEAVLRRSGSWALFKLGEAKLLAQTLRSDDDGNVHSWKQHLIYESQGRTDWVDPRPVRTLKSPYGYGVTMPLTIHGMVVFRTPKSLELPRKQAKAISPSVAPSPYTGYGASQTGYEASQTSAGAPPSQVRRDPEAYDWHSIVAGPITQRRLVGDLTAAVSPDTLYDNLIIQKVSTAQLSGEEQIARSGRDHVQGYLFQGMSRSLGGNSMAHYYSSRGPQPMYISGYIGDTSEGVIDVETQLMRHAETHIVTNRSIPYPYVQSVRGLFYGPARMNTIVVHNPNAPLDNLLQIVREPYANGWFFGEFRSVPVDVDGDGTVELNGMEMYTDLAGRVQDRTPPGPQPSRAFAR